MRKIIVTMWVTLDGFIAGPDGDMAWVGEHFDERMGQYEYDLVSAADTLLLGRVTYESFASSWPKVPDNPSVSEGEKAYARLLNAMRKVVFSKTLAAAEWNNSTLLRDVTPEAIEQLKQQPGKDIIIYGSASLIQTLMNLGLIDEYQLLLYPLVLGSGKPLFKGLRERQNLKLAQSEVFPSGVVLLQYQPKR
jgi:dihydrofolate reductase